VLLTYNSKYVVQSTTPFTTASSSFVDDTYASQTFSLPSDKTVLVIYQVNNNHGDATTSWKDPKTCIKIDGTDRAKTWGNSYDPGYAACSRSFWIGTLGAGSHTITGRVGTVSGSNYIISNRILLILILDGDEFSYVDDNVNSFRIPVPGTSWNDDPYASLTFTPSGNCKALYLYNAAHEYPKSYGYTPGTKAKISIAGVDYAEANSGGGATSSGHGMMTAYANTLTPISTTVKGRLANDDPSYGTGINSRQLGVLLFHDNTLLDIIDNATQITTTSSSLIDDTYATISRATTTEKWLLVLALGTKRHDTNSSLEGECYGISIDSVDKQICRSSYIFDSAYGNSCLTAYSETISAGSHTIQGRFSNNTGSTTAKIDARILIGLWLGTPPVTETKTINSDSVIKQEGVTQTIDSDAEVIPPETVTKSIDSNAIVKRTESLTIDSDAYVVKRQYIDSDAVVKQIVQKDILAASKVVYRVQETINSDAFIKYHKDFYGRLRAQIDDTKDFYVQLKVNQPTPSDPTNVQAFDMYTGEGIKVTWDDVGNYGYNLYLKIGGLWVKQNQTVIRTNYYVVGGLSAEVEYEFKLTGVNGQGDET
jgi:hypothetical protein